jgi:hypothetical protein
MEHLLDTMAAAEWLSSHGIRRSPLTLRKLRCLGGGPRYRTFNGKPYYTEPDLAVWIEERLSAPLGSTSEAGAAMAAVELTIGRNRHATSSSVEGRGEVATNRAQGAPESAARRRRSVLTQPLVACTKTTTPPRMAPRQGPVIGLSSDGDPGEIVHPLGRRN